MGKAERVAAKADREDQKKADAKAKKEAAEDAAWRDAGDGKGKGQAKKEEEERKKAEAAARKAEAKKQLEEEEAAMSAKAKKATPAGAQKVTKHQLDKQKEIEEREKQAAVRERELAAKREVSEDVYAEMVATENVNRVEEDAAAARNVTEALSVLGVKDATEADKHPEKRMKAAWQAYEERNLPELKKEKPGLKMSQYKEMLWKQWQKAPENPLNQAASSSSTR